MTGLTFFSFSHLAHSSRTRAWRLHVLRASERPPCPDASAGMRRRKGKRRTGSGNERVRGRAAWLGRERRMCHEAQHGITQGGR